MFLGNFSLIFLTISEPTLLEGQNRSECPDGVKITENIFPVCLSWKHGVLFSVTWCGVLCVYDGLTVPVPLTQDTHQFPHQTADILSSTDTGRRNRDNPRNQVHQIQQLGRHRDVTVHLDKHIG